MKCISGWGSRSGKRMFIGCFFHVKACDETPVTGVMPVSSLSESQPSQFSSPMRECDAGLTKEPLPSRNNLYLLSGIGLVDALLIVGHDDHLVQGMHVVKSDERRDFPFESSDIFRG